MLEVVVLALLAQHAAPGPRSEPSGSAKCRVLSTSWNDHAGLRRGGYANNESLAEVPYVAERAEMLLGTDTNGCQLPSFDHHSINRSFVLSAKRPFLIRGATDEWPAVQNWARERLLAKHGEGIFTLGPETHETISSILNSHEVGYHTGQQNLPHDCYSLGVTPALGASMCDKAMSEGLVDVGSNTSLCDFYPMPLMSQKYSPFLHTVSSDYTLPDYLQPVRVLQMGVGNGIGVGVGGEEHPTAWWANVKGRKRWILHPPNILHPAEQDFTMKRPSCALLRRSKVTLHCDQEEGTVMVVPAGWYHETCGLDAFSAGIGALSYDGADEPPDDPATHSCPHADSADAWELGSYKLDSVPLCQTTANACPQLPYGPRA